MLLIAALLGLVEGLTEFIPVSSTGHLILLVDLLGFEGPPGKVFEVVIQLGAILAICVLYFRRLLGVLLAAPKSADARRFIAAILIGFLPAALIGYLAHGFIKSVLFSPWVVAVTLVLGGLAILVIERNLPDSRHHKIEEFSPLLAIKIGLCQCLAMIPGMSRSGATIMGALLLRVDRKAATEFSFFLAIPTMMGATVLDLYKNWSAIGQTGSTIIAVGFVVAFIAALAVVKTLVGFVSRHGFAPFGWYRIVLGALMLGVLIAR